MSYKPNFSDNRVLNRIKHAYGFTKGALSTTEPHGWAKVVIDKYFGQQQHDLGKFLRDTLLICTSHRYNKDTGVTKQYMANPTGLEYIKQILLGTDVKEFTQWAMDNGCKKNIITPLNTTPSVSLLFDHFCINQFLQKEHQKELSELDFIYLDKSNRLWHPIQNFKKDYKEQLFYQNKLIWQYDIETCAPSLIHQYSQKQDMDLYLFAIRKYLKDKNIVRNELASNLEIDNKTSKIIINALFCGARIGKSIDFAITKLLDNDMAKVEYLKQDPYITELISDIKTCWTYIEPTMAKAYKLNESTGKLRKIAITSKKKWLLYFELERQVLNHVIKYLKLTNNRYFLEHDGWVTETQINEHELSSYLKEYTGFDVRFKMKKLNNITHLNTTPSVSLLLSDLVY